MYWKKKVTKKTHKTTKNKTNECKSLWHIYWHSCLSFFKGLHLSIAQKSIRAGELTKYLILIKSILATLSLASLASPHP